MHGRSLLGLLTLLVFAASAATAQEVRSLGWKELVPPQAPYDDPFLALSAEQKMDLAAVARARVKQGILGASGSSQDESLKAATARLTAARVDIDALLAKRTYVAAKRREAAEAVNEELNGLSVRISGYVLPLGVEHDKVTEFLLVPYVGACIHEPMPPANQIIHVTVADGFEPKGRFGAVQVSGRIRAVSSTPHLRFVDGEASIPTAYALQAQAIEPYGASRASDISN